MKNKAILIVAGEPNSIFLEIFFKSLKKNNFKKPIILIASKNLVAQQMKKLGFNFNICLIINFCEPINIIGFLIAVVFKDLKKISKKIL